MATVIVSSSRSPHGNTRRIAEVLGEKLDAPVLSPRQATPDVLTQADRIGFGSGIYWLRFDQRLVDTIGSLPDMTGRQAFIFCSSGLPEPPFRRYTRTLRLLLEAKGFRVVDTFRSRGIDTWGPFGWFGGVGKGRPNQDDLAAARAFAARLAP